MTEPHHGKDERDPPLVFKIDVIAIVDDQLRLQLDFGDQYPHQVFDVPMDDLTRHLKDHDDK